MQEDSKQNQRILDDVIQEGQRFDTRLKQMGLDVSLQDVIKGKGVKKTMTEVQEVLEEAEFDEDGRKLRKVEEGAAAVEKVKWNMEYLQGTGEYASRQFNPLLVRPRAPNKRLEEGVRERKEEERVDKMDLWELLREMGLIKLGKGEKKVGRKKLIKCLKSYIRAQYLLSPPVPPPLPP